MRHRRAPAAIVQLVCGAVMQVFGRQTNWASVQEAFKYPKSFLDEIKKVERDSAGHLVHILYGYIMNAEFKPSEVKKKNGAAAGLCNWIIALYKYVEAVEEAKLLGY